VSCLRSRSTSFVLFILLFSALPLFGPATPIVSAQSQCCSAIEFDLHLKGDESTSTLTPFASELSEVYEEVVTQSLQGATEVGSWSLVWDHGAMIPESNWTFSIDYIVENAAGVHANATVEVGIGVNTYVGDSGPGAYFQGEGTIQVSVAIPERAISSGETITITFSVRSLLFTQPQDETALRFVWGDGTNSAIEVEMPLLNIEMQPASVNEREVYFPVRLTSGFGERMWTALFDYQFKIAGQPLNTAPIATIIPGGVEVTFVWSASGSEPDGIRSSNLSILIDSGDAPIQVEMSHDITFGEQGSGEQGWYPEHEPIRTGGSKLTADIKVHYDGKHVDRVVKLEIQGSMSHWMRWGLDNIGNNSLSSTSWWRSPSGAGIPDGAMNNAQVDDAEIAAFLLHLDSSTRNLRDFLSLGLGLDTDGLFEADLFDLNPEIGLDLMGETGFSDTTLRLTIKTSLLLSGQDKLMLIEDFTRAQPTSIWTEIDLAVILTTSTFAGLYDVSSEGIDARHIRAVLTEVVYIEETGLSDNAQFQVQYAVAPNALMSPFITLLCIVVMLVATIVLGLRMTRNRSRILMGVSSVLFIGLAIFIYGFASVPPTIVLSIVGICLLLMLPITLISPKLASDEDEYIMPDRSLGDDLAERAEEERIIPTVTCPACDTVNPVESDQRPLRLPCGGCGRKLRIDE